MTFCFSCLFAMLLSLTACTKLQSIQLPELTISQNQLENQFCTQSFPAGNWQFVHAIDFTMGNDAGSTVIGVTTLTETTIASALITIEGLTLFEAIYKHNNIEIKRALAPFDKPGFAQGLLKDVQAIFLPPAGSEVQIGELTDATPICRYTAAHGAVTDILFAGDCWQLKSYTSERLPERSIIGRSCRKEGELLLPEHLVLNTFGPTGYTLKMTLITADKFQGSRQQ